MAVGPITLNFSLAVVYPDAKIYCIHCPHCNWGFEYALLPDSRRIRCRHCQKYSSLTELWLLAWKPIHATGLTLRDEAARIARLAMDACTERRRELMEGVE